MSSKNKAAKAAESVPSANAEAPLASSLSSNWLLRLAVLVCGASVMVVEILGSRILAPTFGTTLHVWSALITVTLAALAIGYAVGGRIADEFPGMRMLMTVIGAAAAALLISDLLTSVVLRLAYGAGMVGGTFLAALLLFLPTLLLLGMVSPMVVRAAADQSHLGQSVGNLYALSTVGSVAGSLIVSLVLIPRMNVHAALIGTAIALGLLPLIYLVMGRNKVVALLFFVGMALASVATNVIGEDTDKTIMYKGVPHPVTAREPSSYGELVVSDYRSVRYLFLNGVQQGSLRADNLSSAPYAYGLERLSTLKGVPKKMLVWGLGAGVFARAMAEAGTEVTVIEIDPASAKVAREHFGLPAKVKVIIGDARTETLKLTEAYDLIVLDAFSGDSPPFHLLTKEAFESLKTKLAPQGVILGNVVGAARGEGSKVLASVVKTLESVFGKTEVFAVNRKLQGRGAEFVSTNFVFCGEVPATPAAFTLPYPKEMQNYVDTVMNSRVTDLAREDGVLLTDAYAPLEAWNDAAVAAMR